MRVAPPSLMFSKTLFTSLLLTLSCGTEPPQTSVSSGSSWDSDVVGDASGRRQAGDALPSEDTSPTEQDASSDGDTSRRGDSHKAGLVRYPAGQVHSPLTPSVAKALLSIWDKGGALQPDVFMKVGASSTVSKKTLSCFAGSTYDLGEYSELASTLDFFLGGDAAGSTPFDRVTKAAKSGKTAAWAMSGAPSPLEQEFTQLSPGFALVHYGTNDMGMASSYLKAMTPFYVAMDAMIQQLTSAGVIPILTGISPRLDSAKADRWVTAYNALIRGLAQRYQVPFLDLWFATSTLQDHGMASDGLHLNGYPGGACVLSQQGLAFGYNVRNLMVLQALDRLRKLVLLGQPAPDPEPSSSAGDGSRASPWPVSSLPFAHSGDTSAGSVSVVQSYPGCDSDADESGPEVWYRLDLSETTSLRAVVVDGAGVDVDVHLLDESGLGQGCLARGHRAIAGTLSPGTYYVTVDTFVSKGQPASGPYMLLVVPCDGGDPDCQNLL